MQQYNKTKGIKGIVGVYNDAVRFRDMINKQSQERIRILMFWKKYGDTATKEAFKVSRPTLFLWQKTLRESGGGLESLVPKSTVPKNKRK